MSSGDKEFQGFDSRGTPSSSSADSGVGPPQSPGNGSFDRFNSPFHSSSVASPPGSKEFGVARPNFKDLLDHEPNEEEVNRQLVLTFFYTSVMLKCF
jgi:hypothetical protein